MAGRILLYPLFPEDCNVISVDWELLASGPNYPKAARNCVPAGARVGELIRGGLEEVGGAVLEDFHTVGFSLGGQESTQMVAHSNTV